MVSGWSQPVAQVLTRRELAAKSRKVWGGAAMVFLVLAAACIVLSFVAPGNGARVGAFAACAFWLLLAVACWWYLRSGKLNQSSDAPQPLLSVHHEGLVIGGAMPAPWGLIRGIAVEWFDPSPQAPAIKPGAKLGNKIINDALAKTGQPGGLRVNIGVAPLDQAPDVLGMITLGRDQHGQSIITVSCHPLTTEGDLQAVHQALNDLGSRAGVRALR